MAISDTDDAAAPGAMRTSSRLAVAFLFAATLASCASYHAQPLHPQRSAEAFGTRRLDSPALRKAVVPLLPQTPARWPPARWNRATLFAVALAENPQLAVARTQVASALAHEITAGQTPNPTLGLQAEYALHDTKPWLYGISLEFPLRSPARKKLAVDIARLATSNARFKLMNQTWAVRRRLVTALSDWEHARRRSALLQQLVAGHRQLVALEKRRVEAGEDPPDLLAMEQRALSQATQRQAQARAAAVAAQNATSIALGVPPQALDGLKIDWPDWGDPPPIDASQLHTARTQALLSRADLAGAIARYAETERKLQLAIARQYPQFSLTPGYYWDHGIHKFPLGFSLTLPIFNQNQGEIAEARAARELAARKMLALQAEIYDGIAGAERAEVVARDGLDIANHQLTDARRQAQRMMRKFQAGAIGRSAQLTAEISAVQAALDRLATRARLQTARNHLEDALHTPLSGPELKLRRNRVAPASGATS